VKAVILAGGYATRLFPLTSNFPKALLRVAGRPLLEHTLEKMWQTRTIETVYLVTNNRFHRIFAGWWKSLSHKKPEGFRLEVVDDRTQSNEDRMGSVGDLAYVMEKKRVTEDLLVMASDKLFSFELQEFLSYFRSTGATVNACTRVASTDELMGRHGCAAVDEKSLFTYFEEKPQHPASNIKSVAFYVYPANVLPQIGRYLRSGGDPDALGSLTEWLYRQVPIYGWFYKGRCWDIGHPEAYRATNRLFWRNDRGKNYKPVVLVVIPGGRGDFERLRSVLKRFSEWDRPIMIYLVAVGRQKSYYQKKLGSAGFSLPINLISMEDWERSVDPADRLEAFLEAEGFSIDPGRYLVIDMKHWEPPVGGMTALDREITGLGKGKALWVKNGVVARRTDR
jgi:glucose-1-phosphate thymidylyltransferase